ncbi:VPS10 domain-containing receptor SorCS3 [Thelohanellus kitauei]|uniref:VPS10 domain-containing receptor SorCS3 n=1 Tax=Thelohanellus kitauei TaxID=669202 RepID=A0A0C2MUA9_THEKT|nr:VPS10 domain-containing receptor SorCS3 [Thelohanellus kitauei]
MDNGTVRILDISNKFKEIHKFYNIKKFYQIRNQFILFDYDQSNEKSKKIGILHLDKCQDNITKIIHPGESGLKIDSTILMKFHEFFYFHENHYFLAWNKASSLCICALNKYYQLFQLVCNVFPYDTQAGRCSFVVNPHLYGVIYANIKIDDQNSRTYVSFDNGKEFMPLHYEGDSSECRDIFCGVELDLLCSTDFTINNFPDKWIVKFHGTYYRKDSAIRYTFISFDGGKIWKIFNSQIERLIIFNNGGLMFGAERSTGKIWYSYDMGWSWYKQKIDANNLIDIKPIESHNNQVIVAINYDILTNIYTLFLFNFSHVISSCQIISDSTCSNDDFENWYVPRDSGICFQGFEVEYLRKKPLSPCFVNRTWSMLTQKQCPCSLEDFHW